MDDLGTIPPYRVIRSKRKTVSLYVSDDASLIVRAPLSVTDIQIIQSIKKHLNWINKRRKLSLNRLDKISNLGFWGNDEIERMKLEAKNLIPLRVEKYAQILKVNYSKISIRTNTQRWGSCSSTRNLNFNCLLVKVPLPVLDSVIVHELTHLIEMNHSEKFYSIIHKFYPQYKDVSLWLKKEGALLLLQLKKSLKNLKKKELK